MPDRHERLSPSSSDRWLQCPFSAQHYLPDFPNPKREEGSLAHAWCADVLLGRAELDDVPERYRAGVTTYVQHVWSNDAIPAVERFWKSVEIDEFGGTIDCLMVKNRTIVVYDYKNGEWPVSPIDNPQLLCYSVLAQEYFDADQFYGVIVQPNSSTIKTPQVAKYTLSQVNEHRELVAAAAVSDEKQTGSHCLWCPLLRSGLCDEGYKYARMKGWTTRYRHLHDMSQRVNHRPFH